MFLVKAMCPSYSTRWPQEGKHNTLLGTGGKEVDKTWGKLLLSRKTSRREWSFGVQGKWKREIPDERDG